MPDNPEAICPTCRGMRLCLVCGGSGWRLDFGARCRDCVGGGCPTCLGTGERQD